MTFSIKLDERRAVYSPGNPVKGRVVLQSSQEEAIGRVTITFLGRSKTKIWKNRGQNHSIHRGKASLFYYTKTLYVGKYTFRADRYEWPFEFRFPDRPVPNDVGNQFWSEYPFPSNAEQDMLPPSFAFSNHGMSSSFECTTEYKLEAKLSRPPESYIFFAGSLEDEKRLEFMPFRIQESPPLLLKSSGQDFKAKSLRLLPERADTPLTMKEKLSSTFKSSNLPFWNFYLETTFPTQIYPGGPFPLLLRVRHVPSTSTAPEKPEILLQTANVSVKVTVYVRAPGSLGHHTSGGTWKSMLLNVSSLKNPIPEGLTDVTKLSGRSNPEAGLDVTKLSSKFSTRSLQTDFRSSSIVVFSRLDMRFRVLCADKDFVFDVSVPVNILAPLSGPQSGSQGLAMASSEAAVAGPSGNTARDPPPTASVEQLPAYEAGAPPSYEMDG